MVLALADSGSSILVVLEKAFLWFQVVFGIGLMIFIHEMGHFLAAKKIGVRVEAFSLGFGPRIFGFRRGDTEYRLSIIPLGGYVKMAGEDPNDSRSDAPDELQNRTVVERMIIFGAGVFLNFVFAFITIPIIFAVGVPFVKAEVGQVVPGGPAWRAGIQEGDKILEVNGNRVYEFTDIPLNIALGSGTRDDLLIERDGKTMTVPVEPEMNENEGRYQIRLFAPTRHRVAVERGSPAAEAGLKDDDYILTVNGIEAKVWFESESVSGNMGPLNLEVLRKEGEEEKTLKLTVIPKTVIQEDKLLLGIMSRINRIQALRGDLLTWKNGPREGDAVLSINGHAILRIGDVARFIREAPAGDLTLMVERDGKPLPITVRGEMRQALIDDMAVTANKGTNSVVLMERGALAELKDPVLTDGFRILSVNGERTEDFNDIVDQVSKGESETFTLSVSSLEGGAEKRITVVAKPQEDRIPGFSFLPELQVRKLNLVDAMKAGVHCSLYMVKTCYLTLSRILTGDVGSKNIGGIITIGRASYTFAKLGLARLFFFLAILSINLGFLNILPIPILDGGHLLFLLIEKIKGSPVNEKVMGYSQIVGMALILLLLVYVTWNDIQRCL